MLRNRVIDDLILDFYVLLLTIVFGRLARHALSYLRQLSTRFSLRALMLQSLVLLLIGKLLYPIHKECALGNLAKQLKALHLVQQRALQVDLVHQLLLGPAEHARVQPIDKLARCLQVLIGHHEQSLAPHVQQLNNTALQVAQAHTPAQNISPHDEIVLGFVVYMLGHGQAGEN